MGLPPALMRSHLAVPGALRRVPTANLPTKISCDRSMQQTLMEILGHSQIGVTMNVYTHVVQNTQQEALATMDRLLKHPH